MTMTASTDGRVGAGFESVHEVFASVVARQHGTGAAAAAWVDGQWAFDVWGGWADQARTRPWARDTLVMPYSVSKPFAALPVLMLVDHGVVELDAPVSHYWPEFEPAATVRHLLSHQAGVVALDEQLPTLAFADWNALTAALARQEPAWAPGSAHGESALFYGHLVGELVRRVDGRTPGRFLRDEVSTPFGIDFHFGLTPAEQARAAELVGFDDAFMAASAAGRPDLYQTAVANPRGAFDDAVVNSAWWRAAEVPAINGHGTARAIAEFYTLLATGELLSPATLAEAIAPASTGTDQVFGFENSWGLGFGVEPEGFGMGGTGGSIGWWSEAGRYAFAFVTGSAGDHDRADAVENALRSCLGLAPL